MQSGQASCPSADLPRTGRATGADSGEAKAHCSEVTQKGDAQPAKKTTGRFGKSILSYKDEGFYTLCTTL